MAVAESTTSSVAELLCALSFASDLSIGQPMEHGLRSAYLGLRLADALGLPDEDREAVYYGAFLKDAGCTACAASFGAFFGGDDVAPRGDLLLVNPDSARQMFAWFIRHAAPDATLPTRMARLLSFFTECQAMMKDSMASACEVASLFARRLGFPEHVECALHDVREQWNGRGRAFRLQGSEASIAARIIHLAQVLDIAHRFGGSPLVEAMARERRGADFDPELVDALLRLCHQADIWELLTEEPVQPAVLAMRPAASFDEVSEKQMDAVCEALADFTDFKSRLSWNHSRTVADIAVGVGDRLGLHEAELTQVRRAALVHDLGKAAVPVGVLEKEGPLSEGEWEQFQLHAYFTDRILVRVGPLKELAPAAAADHEWMNGQGYPHGLAAGKIPLGGRIIAVADVYARLVRQQPDPLRALHEMKPMAGTQLDSSCYEALGDYLQGAGSKGPARRHAGVLTERETEVLAELAKGSTNRQIAQALVLSEKTVQHHLEHIYGKLGVTCRTSAVIFAVDQGLLD